MIRFLVIFLAGALLTPSAQSNPDYPSKPVRIIVNVAPGGGVDTATRIIADKLREVLGVTVLVENKAGASGMIGGDVIARSAPDGYNLLVSANSLVAVPAIYGNAPYDWKTAFQPISHIQAVPAVIVVTPSSPIKTLADFLQGRPRAAGQAGHCRFRRRHHQPHRDRAFERSHRRQVYAGPLQGQRRHHRSTAYVCHHV